MNTIFQVVSTHITQTLGHYLTLMQIQFHGQGVTHSSLNEIPYFIRHSKLPDVIPQTLTNLHIRWTNLPLALQPSKQLVSTPNCVLPVRRQRPNQSINSCVLANRKTFNDLSFPRVKTLINQLLIPNSWAW